MGGRVRAYALKAIIFTAPRAIVVAHTESKASVPSAPCSALRCVPRAPIHGTNTEDGLWHPQALVDAL